METELLSQSAVGQIGTVFIAGFLSILTPCVYPLIPVTLAVLGTQEKQSKLKAFLVSLSYVLGICVTYTVLGSISAQGGMLFGSLLGNPFVVTLLSIFLFLLTLSSLEVITIKSLSKIQTWASRIGGSGYRGAFLMGTASGFVAAPCVGPVLVVVLGIAAASKSAVWGALLLFFYSLGLGIPFLVLGTFSGLIQKLPRSGSWMTVMKFLTAILLLIVVLYLLSPYIPDSWRGALPKWITALAVLGSLITARLAYRIQRASLKLICAVICAVSLFELTIPLPVPPTSISGETPWLTTIETGVEEAKRTGTIVMIDLFAEWCAACKELDAKTFSDSRVKASFSSISKARIDFTNSSDYSSRIADTYSVTGLPCILFLTATGKEIPNTRISGFIPPDEFLAVLAKAKANSGL